MDPGYSGNSDSRDQAGFTGASVMVLTKNASVKDRSKVKIFVGNLSFSVDDQALSGLFEQHGGVDSATVVVDRDTGRSRGFGFVEMADEDARKAIDAMNGVEVEGRALTVNEARPKKRDGGGGGGGGRGGGGNKRW